MAGRKRKGTPPELVGTLSAEFGRHLEKLVDGSGLSAKEFAAAIGKTDQSVWSYFRGINVPHINEWPAIAKELGLESYLDLLPPPKRRNSKSGKAK